MRRAVIIIASLLIAACVTFSVFLFLNNRSFALTIDDLITTDRTIDANGHFEGKFKPDKIKADICDYSFEIKDKTLYLTIYATYGSKEALPTDENGYTVISFDTQSYIENIYYSADGRESLISFEQK